jgi:hypothetical protein
MTASTYPASDLEWSRRTFAMLNEGGVWGVPRSGLVFQKRGAELVLIDRMPWAEGMPLTAEELRTYQDEDFALIRDRFVAAGIQVGEA